MDIRKRLNPMLKLGDLAIFIAVVEQGSFTKVADYCQKPKSTISRHIRELEDNLGVRLLERNTRRLTLTDSGEQLLQRARYLLDEVEVLEREVGRQGAPEGKIKMFVPIVLASLCADQIADFCEQHPGIHIDMNSTAAGQNLGIDTRFDLIVYIGQPPDSSFIQMIGNPYPHVGVKLNSKGNTSQAYAGLTWRWYLQQQFLLKGFLEFCSNAADG